MEEKRECCHTTKTKERTEKEYKDLKVRCGESKKW